VADPPNKEIAEARLLYSLCALYASSKTFHNDSCASYDNYACLGIDILSSTLLPVILGNGRDAEYHRISAVWSDIQWYAISVRTPILPPN